MPEDVIACFGQFACFADGAPQLGIRGLPAGFDLRGALEEVLRAKEATDGKRVLLQSELDEQGLNRPLWPAAGGPWW